MVFLKHAFQTIESDMGINLSGRNVGVAEQGLHRAQVGAVFYHVSSTAVAEHVRTGVPPGLD